MTGTRQGTHSTPGDRHGGSGGSPESRGPGPRAASARPGPTRKPRFPSRPSLASACGRELELQGVAGVLLGPQFSEQVGDPAVDRPEPVEPRVAGPAEGDQSGRGVGWGAVMHDERIRSQADAAQVAVTRQDPFPAPAEAGAGAAGAVVAGLAEPAAVEIRGSAGAAQGELFLKVGGHGGEARSALSFICDKGRYYRHPGPDLPVSKPIGRLSRSRGRCFREISHRKASTPP